MATTRQRSIGFTIVEMLVVIGIIAALAAILLPALSGAQRRAKKTEETNRLRQVGTAWMVYSNNNEDSALPGYLEHAGVGASVIGAWRVAYRFPDKSDVLEDDAQPWVYRLATYFDFSHDVLHGYLDEDEDSVLIMSSSASPGVNPAEVTEIAFNPAFGYNAYHVGGWWRFNTSTGRPELTFASATADVPSGQPTYGVSVVSRSPSTIRNSSRLILFASSGEFPAGDVSNVDDYHLGSHYVVPPWQPDDGQVPPPSGNGYWEQGSAASYLNSFVTNAPVPIGRYTGHVAALYADLHSDPIQPGTLDDQRYWIDSADHSEFKFDP